MTGGDKGELFIRCVPLFTLSLFSKIVCSLWLIPFGWNAILKYKYPGVELLQVRRYTGHYNL